MPELPEVQTIIDGLSIRIIGVRIEKVRLARVDIVRHGRSRLTRSLTGRRIDRIDREGKRIRLHVDDGGLLVIHLGMSGRLTVEPIARPALTHTHLRLKLTDRAEELRFRDPRRFGGVWFFPAGAAVQNNGSGALRPLGPDALTIRVPVLRNVLRSRRAIKSLLLDQYVISGLGNIYCDEALFTAAIHPLRRAAELTDVEVRRLACGIRSTLRAALEAGGTTLSDYRKSDGSEGLFQFSHRVYGRNGLPCLRCGLPIRRLIVSGRGTHYCEHCQQMPSDRNGILKPFGTVRKRIRGSTSAGEAD